MERLQTGVVALDQVLHGGIPIGGSVLAVGRPGSGKTIPANQTAFNNARSCGWSRCVALPMSTTFGSFRFRRTV